MIDTRATGVLSNLGNRRRYGYSLGNFSKSLQSSSVDLLYMFYLIHFLKTPPALAGGAIFAALIPCSLADLIFGHVVDRRGSVGWGYRKLMIFGGLASAISFPTMFLLPSTEQSFSFEWAIGWFLVFRLSSTILDVPHNTLLSALTPVSRERGRLSTLRFLFSSVGNLVVAGLIALFLPQQAVSLAGMATYVCTITLLFVVTMATCVWAVGPVQKIAHPEAVSVSSLFRALEDLSRNATFVRVLLLFVLAACMITVFPRMAIFYAESFLGSASKASVLISAQVIGQILSLPVWSLLQDRLTKRQVGMVAYGGFAIIMSIFLLLAPSSLRMAAPLFSLAGAFLCGLTVMNWAIAPDTIKCGEIVPTKRHEAFTFGLLLAAIKVSTGAGAGFIGLSLQISGFEASVAKGYSRIPGIAIGMAGIPLAGAIACLIILAKLQLGNIYQKKHASP